MNPYPRTTVEATAASNPKKMAVGGRRRNILHSCHRKFDARSPRMVCVVIIGPILGGNREQLCSCRCRNKNSVFLADRGSFDLCIAACVDHPSSVTSLRPATPGLASVPPFSCVGKNSL